MGKIRKISATGSEPVKTALTVQKTVGATSITVNSIEGWHTGTGSDDEVPFVIYAVKPTGEIVAGSQSSWMGVVSRSSSTINNLRLTGGQDQIYPVGSKVVATSTAAWANELAEALLVSHNPDGSLKTQDVPNNSIDGAKLKDGTVDGAKIKDGSIEPGKIKNIGVITGTANTRRDSEQTWNQNVWQKKNGSDLTFTTTQPNQKVVLLASLQFFQGGYARARWKINGSYSSEIQFRPEIGSTTTAAQTIMIVYNVPTAGTYNASLEIKPTGTGLRVIDGEGSANYAVIPALG